MNRSNIILFTLLITSISWIVYNKMNQPIEAPTGSVKNNDQVLKLLWNNYSSFLVKDDYSLIDGEIKVVDSLSNEFSLHEVLGENVKLVLRYSSTDCMPCISETIDLLKSSGKFADNFIILTDDKDERSFRFKKKTFAQDFPIYMLKLGNLGLSFEGKGMPFMFLVHPDFHISALFTPVTQQQIFTKGYLNSISDKL